MASRIIPARAGFTPDFIPGPPMVGDHPRSRGVYPSHDQGDRMVIGSSPLARGLHGRVVGGDVVVRIIPARAGFTQ